MAAVAGGDIHPHHRVFLMIGGQHLRQPVQCVVDGDARPESAAYFTLHRIQPAPQLFHLVRSGLAVSQHLFARRGEPDALPGAEHDLHAQLPFQCLDPFGKRGLGHIKFICCVGDVAGLVQNAQQLKVLFIHGGSPSVDRFLFCHGTDSISAVPFRIFIIHPENPKRKRDCVPILHHIQVENGMKKAPCTIFGAPFAQFDKKIASGTVFVAFYSRMEWKNTIFPPFTTLRNAGTLMPTKGSSPNEQQAAAPAEQGKQTGGTT